MLTMIHRIGACLVVALLAGCAPAFPPIAAGPGGDAAFKARIATSYPPGSSGVLLAELLVGQGFTVQSDLPSRRFTALATPDNLPCYSRTRVDWTEDRRGRILQVQAQRSLCS